LNDIHLDKKKELFALALPKLNKEQTQKILSILSMHDFIDLFKKKRPTFEINKVNKKILTNFEEREWITKFKKDKNKPNFYRAYGREID